MILYIMALYRFINGVTKELLCYQRMLHVQYISIDDFLITPIYIEKTIYPPSGERSASSCWGKLSLAAEPLHD